MHPLFLLLDPYLIWFYRLTPWVRVNFVLGTLAVAVLALSLGELTARLAGRLVRRRLAQVSEEARRYHELSLKALEAGAREAYEAANKVANEAFNKVFYMQVALSATYFWPVVLALGWMQSRFGEVEFPLPGTPWSLGGIGVFIIIYAVAYFTLKQVKRLCWPFRSKGGATPDPPQSSPGGDMCELSAVHSADHH